MKKILYIIIALVGISFTADAQTISDVAVSALRLNKDGQRMNVGFDIDLSKIDVANRRSLHIIPIIKRGNDSVALSPIGVYSRGRYINYLRKGESIFEDMNEKVYKEGEQPAVFKYEATVPYHAWMDGSELYLNKEIYGCCDELVDKDGSPVGSFIIPVFEPKFIYIQPSPELSKQRELSGSAFIDFVVSRTDINPSYRNNKEELTKIIATIDSVKNDSDIKVRGINLKGFASPESPYSNNERLAKGRTAALKEYVNSLYNFDDNVISTSYEPENWEGLRAFVEESILVDKKEILAVIDKDMDPDKKELEIKTKWPDEYSFLLYACYPSLRKTDYSIEYTIVDFTDINKIVEIFHTHPSKLSLNELYIASTTFEPGSENYVAVFETAVKMYPNDPIANLNAANIAIAGKKFTDAKAYLDKAGDSIEATYARGIYYVAIGKYDEGQSHLEKAREGGILEAAQMLEQCAKLKEYHRYNR